jgi:hypothetical protein
VARKQVHWIALIMIITASLSALLAYRLGLHQKEISGASIFARSGRGGCVDFRDAQSRVGEVGCVSGKVLRAFTSRGSNSFLDFCPDYRDCPFSAVIFASDRSKFGDLDTLAGRQIEIEGLITVYQGRAEIIIHGPQQIRVLP